MWARRLRSLSTLVVTLGGDHRTKTSKTIVVSFYQNQPGCDAATFVRHLDSVYIDPNAAARALNRLQAMKQGRESFATFLPKFEKELGESQLIMVPDMVKIGYLRGALNT